MRPQVLVLAARNMAEPSGEWRLISNRARALWMEAHIGTLVYALTRRERFLAVRSAPSVEGMEVEHFPYHGVTGLVLAVIRMLLSARRCLQKGHMRGIVISGVAAYILAPALRSSGPPLFVDVHGPLEEWLDYPPRFARSRLISGALYRAGKRLERLAMKCSIGALVVSEPLERYVRERYPVREVFTIPSGTLENLSSNELQNNRRTWRERLGLSGNTVFVYSGGLSRWQLIGKACELFRNMKMLCPDIRLLLLTPHPQRARAIALDTGVAEEDLLSITLPPTEAVEALAACDVGVMLRETRITNEMAFPNKFAEYLQAGLLIITSPGLEQPSKIVTKYGIGLSVHPDELGDLAMLQRLHGLIEQRGADLGSYYERCREIVNLLLNMRSLIRPFARAIGTWPDEAAGSCPRA